jgi:chemotaxis methyl-accepting protein methylase
MDIKKYTITLEVDALSNTTNDNFPENVYAVDIVESAFTKATHHVYRTQMDYLKNGGKETDEYYKYLDGIIKAYEEIRSTIK